MRAYERFLNYVTIGTASDRTSKLHPSTAAQFVLAKKLAEEMRQLGLSDAYVTDNCYVYGSLSATPGYETVPSLGLIAHMDTSQDARGDGVNPVLHKEYDGSPIVLPATGTVMDVEQFPFLKNYVGQTVITTEGTTLLGADDKAGIAEILTAIECINERGIPHGKICVAFTPDEEIGEGADFFDLEAFGADYAYTLDGGDVGDFCYENFNGAFARVLVKGFGVHPGSAKDQMINAQNVAMEFHQMLPEAERPEHTENREGFFHLHNMTGTVDHAFLEYIIRDHDREQFEHKKRQMEKGAAILNQRYGDGTITLEMQDTYYNMADIIRENWEIAEKAHEAIRMQNLEPRDMPVRGGTDGARISYMGLPCPNIGTGGYNWHGETECISVESMDKVVEIILSLVQLYLQ